jgi:antitoxin (DNA-binding transcriptional repressor) of toxin-antitoxin stability system
MMFHMKTASVRELRQNFPRIMGWLDEGSEIEITHRRQAIAKLVPLRKPAPARKKMPDLMKRLNKVFGDRTISRERMEAILRDNKGRF